jgi:hypothetical protein
MVCERESVCGYPPIRRIFKEMISMGRDIDWDRHELMSCSSCRLLRDSGRDSVCPQHGKEIFKLIDKQIKQEAIKKKNEQDRFDRFMQELNEEIKNN